MAPPVEQEPYPFRCPRAGGGDDVDHVVRRHLRPAAGRNPRAADSNPFVQYRTLFHSYHVARSHGMPDEEFVDMVRQLDAAIAAVDGHGFRATPFRRCERLTGRLGLGAGGLWVKDETGNVSGSHKARHLAGIMLYLEVIDRLGIAPAAKTLPLARGTPPSVSGHQPLGTDHGPLATGQEPKAPPSLPLAIASCGNAALAAAVVARAAGRQLNVYVPASGDPPVLERLGQLGAGIHTCARIPGLAGDPCYRSFREALGSGALPFCVQGSDNGLTIEGGETLAWEMIDQFAGIRLDRLIVQVGGGALASACIQAFAEAAAFGWINYAPRVFTVQTRGAHPLERAYERLVERILGRLAAEGVIGRPVPGDRQATADVIRRHAGLRAVRDEVIESRLHRSQFMWPWETEPRSLAHGILDDETYDWAEVVEGMLLTGGYPLVVDEQTLSEANALARDLTGVNADHTGTAGLAGLLHLLSEADRPSPGEQVAVIFSGVRRQ